MLARILLKLKDLTFPIYEKTFLGLITTKSVANVRPFSADSIQETDISDHLHFLNLFVNLIEPNSIVELGTRGGESTRVFTNYCERFGIQGYSVDLSSQPAWLESINNWKHIVSDDCLLGREISKSGFWPDGTPFEKIDLLFIDTSHEYSHTSEELEVWVPLVRKGGWILFHDTNLSGRASRRLSGNLNYGWDNSRGVTRAIEEYFKIVVADHELYSELQNKELNFIFHIPWNNGLTALQIN